MDFRSHHRPQKFALETTLRSPTFEQSRLAHEHGFWSSMDYVAAGRVEESIRRNIEHSYRGGHSASERLIREIYHTSMQNVFAALDFRDSGIEVVRVYGNSEVGGQVRQFTELPPRAATATASEIPGWLESLFKPTEYDVATLRKAVKRRPRPDYGSR